MTNSTQSIAFARPCLGNEEAVAAAAAVTSGWIVGGPHLAKLESQFSEVCENKFAVGVSSWTAGAFLVLKALGIGPGDEVIVPSLTFIASVNVISHAGATPVFVEINPDTFNIDVEDLKRRITPRTRAIMPIDQIGLPCEIDLILELAAERGLTVILDAACSVGSVFRGRPAGSHAPISIFSLHARKVVTTGEGGMIITGDEELAARLKRLRHQGMSLSDFERHGSSPTRFESYPEIGYNFRITDVQAAIGTVQMRKLKDMVSRRHAVADRYLHGLADHPRLVMPHVPSHTVPNWQSFQVSLRPRDGRARNTLMETLFERGIPTRRGVMASHLEAPYLQTRTHLPVTEAVANSTFQLPIYPDLSEANVDLIIATLWDLG